MAPPQYKCPFASDWPGRSTNKAGIALIQCDEVLSHFEMNCAFYDAEEEQCAFRAFVLEGTKYFRRMNEEEEENNQ